MVKIVHGTRVLVARKTRWPEIERQVLDRYALPGSGVYTCEEPIVLANQMLHSIVPGEYRGYVPEGKAILFHHMLPWKGFPEEVHIWQASGVTREAPA